MYLINCVGRSLHTRSQDAVSVEADGHIASFALLHSLKLTFELDGGEESSSLEHFVDLAQNILEKHVVAELQTRTDEVLHV